MSGHINNPTGANEVKGGVLEQQAEEAEKAADQAKAKDGKKDKDEDAGSRRKPDPSKDDQLRKALELVKDPVQWQKSLGLAAAKKTDDKTAKRQRRYQGQKISTVSHPTARFGVRFFCRRVFQAA